MNFIHHKRFLKKWLFTMANISRYLADTIIKLRNKEEIGLKNNIG